MGNHHPLFVCGGFAGRFAARPFETPPKEGGSSGRTVWLLILKEISPLALRRPLLLGPSRRAHAQIPKLAGKAVWV